MKEVDPPPPLDASQDTPEELRRVMFALGREGPSRATLDRAANALAPWLDASPGLEVPSALDAARATGTKLMVVRAVAALLVLGGSAYLVHRASNGTPTAQKSTHEEVQAPWAATRAVEAPVVQASPAIVPAVEALTERLPVSEQRVEPVHQEQTPEVQTSRRERRHAALRRSAPNVAAPALVEAPRPVDYAQPVERSVALEPTTDTTPERAAPDDTIAEQTQVQPRSPLPTVRASAPPPTDEYTLLWQARTRLKRDPAGALAILDGNAERFERMQLAPEREVLAVEALRALGRKGEADRRLRAFRARYPGSIHLRRLQVSE